MRKPYVKKVNENNPLSEVDLLTLLEKQLAENKKVKKIKVSQNKLYLEDSRGVIIL